MRDALPADAMFAPYISKPISKEGYIGPINAVRGKRDGCASHIIAHRREIKRQSKAVSEKAPYYNESDDEDRVRIVWGSIKSYYDWSESVMDST